MGPFEVTVLGCGSASPSLLRSPSSQVLNCKGHFYLLDCGEGTQLRLRKYGIKLQRIEVILITHLHGDHYLGLVGLLQTMHLLGRKLPITLIGPKPLQEIVELHNKYAHSKFQYPLEYRFTNPDGLHKVWEDKNLTISSFPLSHRIDCTGFLFREKESARRVRKSELEKYKVPLSEIGKLKLGLAGISEDGETVQNGLLTRDPEPPKSFAFCSDSAYNENCIPIINRVDVLYHESTFLESELKRAKKTHHSTAKEAATLALKAQVGKLLIGHFSSRYKNTSQFLEEASAVFPNTYLCEEGSTFLI